MIFFTADTHFGHANILKPTFCDRPWSSTLTMNAGLIKNWNSLVAPGDTVYHLGDFAWHSMGKAQQERIFGLLNGEKHLIIGNHDDAVTCGLPWKSISIELKITSPAGIAFSLSHYPPGVEVDPEVMHLHGHKHYREPQIMPVFDVGVDANGYKPVSMTTLDRLASGYLRKRERFAAFYDAQRARA